jgi:hypothetical protein
MLNSIRCWQCGTSFRPNTPTKKFCSIDCRNEAASARAIGKAIRLLESNGYVVGVKVAPANFDRHPPFFSMSDDDLRLVLGLPMKAEKAA